MRQPLRLTWRKSSYSNEGVNCVHVAAVPDGTVRLRESDDPRVILSATREELAGLVAALKGRRGAPWTA
ncbi:DUF397 domain-containing protein [Streptomyces rimosus]|uniref:DUF397 domain-containing protein n=1 Tax=Streptomyces rimosus TaxID=1927 RepID=UPI00099C8369|nr:DUF397 domain-containing protein [Streptomyces rimosus]